MVSLRKYVANGPCQEWACSKTDGKLTPSGKIQNDSGASRWLGNLQSTSASDDNIISPCLHLLHSGLFH